jgi:hypothetical protein
VSHGGELASILATPVVVRRPGTSVYVTVPRGAILDAAAALEGEGTTFVLEREAADRAGLAALHTLRGRS